VAAEPALAGVVARGKPDLSARAAAAPGRRGGRNDQREERGAERAAHSREHSRGVARSRRDHLNTPLGIGGARLQRAAYCCFAQAPESNRITVKTRSLPRVAARSPRGSRDALEIGVTRLRDVKSTGAGDARR